MRDFEIVDGNLRRSMQCYTHATESGEVREMPGVLIASAGVDSPAFNAALLLEAVPAEAVELDRRIMIAKVFFEARGLPWSFWVCEALLDPAVRAKAKSVFRKRRLGSSTECPGMLAERIAPPGRPLPALECRLVTDAETRLAFCHITSLAFRLPFETSLAIYNSDGTWRTDFIAYVGYLDGQPVATVATVAAAGAIGVYSVATLPEYQGKGVAEKLIRHGLERASEATGLERTVLQSTRPGQSLYHRMGYREVTKFTVYVSE